MIPCLQAGYTVLSDFSLSVTYDGGAAVDVDFVAGDHWDSVHELMEKLASRAQTAAGGTWSGSVISTVGYPRLSVGAGHNFTLAWGATDEGIRLEAFLGWVADLSPAGVVFTSASRPDACWWPTDASTILDLTPPELSQSSSVHRTNSVADILSLSSPTGACTLSLLVACAGSGDLSALDELADFISVVLDGESFSVMFDRTAQATSEVYRLDPAYDTLAFTAYNEFLDTLWITTISLWGPL